MMLKFTGVAGHFHIQLGSIDIQCWMLNMSWLMANLSWKDVWSKQTLMFMLQRCWIATSWFTTSYLLSSSCHRSSELL